MCWFNYNIESGRYTMKKHISFVICVIGTVLVVVFAALVPKLILQGQENAFIDTEIEYITNVDILETFYNSIPVMRYLYDRNIAIEAHSYDTGYFDIETSRDYMYNKAMRERARDILMYIGNMGVISIDVALDLYAELQTNNSVKITTQYDNAGFESIGITFTQKSADGSEAFTSHILLEIAMAADDLVSVYLVLPPWMALPTDTPKEYADAFIEYLELPVDLDWQTVRADAIEELEMQAQANGITAQYYNVASKSLRADIYCNWQHSENGMLFMLAIESYYTYNDERFERMLESTLPDGLLLSVDSLQPLGFQ